MLGRRCPLVLAGLFIAALALAGCSGSRSAQSAANESDNPYVREVTPFAVRDADGAPYDHPFLGGLNVPRPQFVDIDGDGDVDLFVQERTNEVMFFENTGSPGTPDLTWRTDQYRGLPVGEWFRFADMDQDGDPDLLAEEPFSHIRYYRNTGSATQPSFELATDTLRDVDGDPIFSDRQNIPNVTDIDCNGQLDLFIGRLDGTVMRYEEVDASDGDVPRFELITERFEDIEIVNQIGTLLHGANTLTFIDIDNDGDKDLFWGDFFEPSLLLIENTAGACESPQLQSEPRPFPPSNPVSTSGYNAPTLADWGQDGNLDLFVGVLGGAYSANTTLTDNLHFYERGDDGTFHHRTARFIYSVDVGSESMPAVGDLDSDGDADLLLANKIDPDSTSTSLVYRFVNQGTAGDPVLQQDGVLDLPEGYHYAPALGDLDGDGDADLLLGTWKGNIAYYRNTGGGAFEPVNQTLASIPRGSNSAPALGDIDGDGDLDLFVGESDGTINFFRNEGTPQEPQFTLAAETFNDIDVGHRSAPALTDLDSDGDLDLVIGSRDEGLSLYRNTGSASSPAFTPADALQLDAPRLATPIFADWDGDSDLDVMTGGDSGGLFYFERQ
jgi:hypothetical protein